MTAKNAERILKTARLIFFDFDRTLCVHDYIRQKDDVISDFFFGELKHQGEIHRNDAPLLCMKAYIEDARKRGIEVACLSHTLTNLRDGFNKNFLDRYYGGMKYYTVSKAEDKPAMMDAVMRSTGGSFGREQVAIVDDRMPTLEAAENWGFLAAHLSDVILWYETKGNE